MEQSIVKRATENSQKSFHFMHIYGTNIKNFDASCAVKTFDVQVCSKLIHSAMHRPRQFIRVSCVTYDSIHYIDSKNMQRCMLNDHIHVIYVQTRSHILIIWIGINGGCIPSWTKLMKVCKKCFWILFEERNKVKYLWHEQTICWNCQTILGEELSCRHFKIRSLDFCPPIIKQAMFSMDGNGDAVALYLEKKMSKFIVRMLFWSYGILCGDDLRTGSYPMKNGSEALPHLTAYTWNKNGIQSVLCVMNQPLTICRDDRIKPAHLLWIPKTSQFAKSNVSLNLLTK